MTEPVRPVQPVRPVGDRPQAELQTLPAVVEAVDAETEREAGRRPRARRGNDADFAAHVLGQDGRKRGLRGGPEVLEAARATYLRTEYSGPNDRRPAPGLVKRTEV